MNIQVFLSAELNLYGCSYDAMIRINVSAQFYRMLLLLLLMFCVRCKEVLVYVSEKHIYTANVCSVHLLDM